ncbi:unnamed protein product, partial [Clonostachys byssicola]
MPHAWQLWLSPRPSRTPTNSKAQIYGAHDAVLFEFIRQEGNREVVRETHHIDNKIVKDGLSGPPIHIHMFQDEYFQIESGVIAVQRGCETIVASQGDGIIMIPAGTRHRFWAHSSGAEDLVFKVWAQPQGLERGFDEKFIRNLIGYSRDCQRANMEPSPFQLMLFAEASGTVASPPFWLPIWFLKSVQRVLAYGIGGFLLGYKDGYPEYSDACAGSDSH